MTMMWVGVGSAVLGTGSQIYGARQAGKNQPGQPGALPAPATPGSWSTGYGGGWIDPLTHTINNYTNGFDPQQLQQQWDADSMYNQFMGTGNGNITGNIDWQIKKLQQQLEQMRSGTGKNNITNADNKSRILGDNALLVDDKGNIDSNAVQRYSSPGDNNPFYSSFLAQTQGNYGGGFGKWMQDHVNRTLKPMAEKYKADLGTQAGNQQTSGKAEQDLQNQIDYLTQARGRYSGAQSENPLMKWTKDAGPTWQGGDNSNPYLGGWEGMMRDKMTASGQTPGDIYGQYGIPDASAQGQFQSKMNGLINGLNGYDRVSAPRLDTGASGAMQNSLDFATQQNFANQKAARDAQMARRGMASSAVNEIGNAQDSLNLGNALNQNRLSAANYFNQNTAQQFGMDAQAAQQNNQADLARRGLQLQYTNDLNNTQFSQGLARAQFANNVQNQLFGQALSSLNANNAMRQQTRDWNTQDYQFGRQENADLYNRNMNMYNLLNNQRQQAFGNQQSLYGMGNQAQSIYGGQQMQLADWQNQSNNANAQMQNAWNMQNAQNAQARTNATYGAIGNMFGSMGNAFGRYSAQNYNPNANRGWGGQISDPGQASAADKNNPFGAYQP